MAGSLRALTRLVDTRDPMNGKDLLRFDLNLIKVFLAVWEMRSLTAAGQALGLTQPAVSHSLKRLRETFDDPLFVRVGNCMVPTETATRLRASFEAAMTLVGQTVQAARQFDPGQTRRVFRLAMSDTGEFVILPRVLAALEHKAPGVTVQTVTINPDDIEGALRTGRADLAIGYQPALEGTACTGRQLFDDRLVCVLRSGHPNLGASWTAETFAGLGFLDVSHAATGHRMARSRLEQLGISYRVVARLEHFTVLPEVVRRTDYAAIFPHSVLTLMSGQAGLEIRELPFDIPSYAIKLWVHELFGSDPGIIWISDLIAGAVGDTGTKKGQR